MQLRKSQRARETPAAQIAAETLELPLMRGENQRRAAAIQECRLPRAGIERVRVQDQGAARLPQHGVHQCPALLPGAEARADHAGLRFSEPLQDRRKRREGDAPALRSGQRGHDRAVTTRRCDRIEALRHQQLRQSRAAALTGVRREHGGPGIAAGSRDHQGAAVAVFMAVRHSPRQREVRRFCLRQLRDRQFAPIPVFLRIVFRAESVHAAPSSLTAGIPDIRQTH